MVLKGSWCVYWYVIGDVSVIARSQHDEVGVFAWPCVCEDVAVCTHDVEATQLVATHDADDGDELPADGRITEQTEERHGLLSVLHSDLSIHLLQFRTHILLSQKRLECCGHKETQRERSFAPL